MGVGGVQAGTTIGVLETALNVITVGGYGGVKRAYQDGKLNQGGMAALEGYAEGVMNGLTFGWFGIAMDVANAGGTLSDTTKIWALDVTGITDVGEGGRLIGEGEVLEGLGRILEGAGKTGGRNDQASVCHQETDLFVLRAQSFQRGGAISATVSGAGLRTILAPLAILRLRRHSKRTICSAQSIS